MWTTSEHTLYPYMKIWLNDRKFMINTWFYTALPISLIAQNHVVIDTN